MVKKTGSFALASKLILIIRVLRYAILLWGGTILIQFNDDFLNYMFYFKDNGPSWLKKVGIFLIKR